MLADAWGFAIFLACACIACEASALDVSNRYRSPRLDLRLVPRSADGWDSRDGYDGGKK